MTTHTKKPLKLEKKTLSKISKDIYKNAKLRQRLLATYRPYICPIEKIIPFIAQDSKVLDIGCGTGSFLLTLAHLGRIQESSGVDVSEPSITIANKTASTLPNGSLLSFTVCQETKQWPDKLFDVVSMIDVLHHVPIEIRQGFISTALSKVRPGGIFIYKDMCIKPLWRAAANKCHDLLLAKQWITHHSISEVEKWASLESFTRINRSDFQRFVYGHEQLIMKKTSEQSQAKE